MHNDLAHDDVVVGDEVQEESVTVESEDVAVEVE